MTTVEQVVVQGLLSLSILLEFPPGEARGLPVLKDLLFGAKELGLELNFRVFAPAETAAKPRRHRSVLTLIGEERVSAAAVARITRVMADRGFNIETIQWLEHRRIAALEMVVSSRGPAGAEALKNALLPVGREYGVDLALQPDSIFRRMKRLVVFDLDSTLIRTEIIDELAEVAGTAREVRAVTQKAMEGKLNYRASLVRRVKLLKGLPEHALAHVYKRLPFTPGAKELIQVLQRMGYRTAVISGGFTYFTERLQRLLGLDHAFANRLEIKQGKLTGRLLEPVLDGEGKARLLQEIARGERIRLDQVIAIGDGANDLPMLKKARLGVAFNAKPAVREAAEHSLNQKRLDAILFLLVISEQDIAGLKKKR